MKIKDLMTANPTTCTPDTNLAAAAALLLEADCGFLPVLDDGKLVGVVTDRDMYIALATRNQLASRLSVGDVARTNVLTCEPEDDVHDVLDAMRMRRVRRVPVVGFGGTVLGVASMNDILLAAGPDQGVRTDKIVDTFQGICAHHHPAPHVNAA